MTKPLANTEQQNQRRHAQQAAESGAEYRKLPAMDALLSSDGAARLVDIHGRSLVAACARDLLEEARTAIAAGGSAPEADTWPVRLARQLAAAARPSITPVINASGIIIHTNLGRAPLSEAAQQAMLGVARGYSNLEYDLTAGKRGSRHVHARTLLAELTGAEDAIVVNNNAAAVYFVLGAFCMDKEVLISRGELVEIGGGFRIPDVLRQSGARLVEVGATNRTHIHDFAAAMTPDTAAIMRVHSSNFRQIGFVSQPTLHELADLAAAHAPNASDANGRPLLIDDLGSGTLLDTQPYGLAPEPMVQASVAAGADLVAFSGDKLLGGPQAGIIVGRADLIERLRSHPMARALRVDKLTLAALEATLQGYRRGQARDEIPVWQMISVPLEEIATRAVRWQQTLAASGVAAAVTAGESAVGGGSLPGEILPTRVLVLDAAAPDSLAARLRHADPPIIARIQQDQLLFDPRTVLPGQDDALLTGLITVLQERHHG